MNAIDSNSAPENGLDLLSLTQRHSTTPQGPANPPFPIIDDGVRVRNAERTVIALSPT